MESNLLLILSSVLSLLVIGLLITVLLIVKAWARAKRVSEQHSRELALVQQTSDVREQQILKLESEFNAAQSKTESLLHEKHLLEKEIVERKTVLEKEREAFEERIKLLERAEEELKETFQSLSSEALKSNNTAFLELANSTFEKLKIGAKGDLDVKEKAISEMVKPIHEGLKKFDDRMQEMEKSRVAQISSVSDLVNSLTEANQKMRVETSNLVSALRAPNIRGQWGELQLRRTIEISGMVKYCDFVEQKQIGDESVNLRPDVVVNLPNDRQVVVDSKAPLKAYLEANETEDQDVRELKLQMHAKMLRDHLKRLGQKAYHEHLKESPEFVVLFLPGEVFFSAALEVDPGLIEYGVEQKVLIATPTTLIALLKAIAYGWKNQEIAEQAGEIRKLGGDLYESVVKVLDHMGNVRKHLNQTVNAFNQTISSIDRRLLPRIRKFKSLNAGTDKAIPQSEMIETPIRSVMVPLLEEIEDEGENRSSKD